MKNRAIILLSGLVIGLAFSVLLVRLASLDLKTARQREQIVSSKRENALRQAQAARTIRQQQEQIALLAHDNARMLEQIAVLRETADQARQTKEGEISHQREQSEILRESATQARQAFDRMQDASRPETTHPRFHMAAIGGTVGIIAIGHNFETGESSYKIIYPTADPKTQAVNDLDAALIKLEQVSKKP